MQFIAYLIGNPHVQGWHRRDFKWNDAYKCYVYQDRTFDEKEFNTVMPVIWKKYREVFPQFKIVSDPEPAPAPAAVVAVPAIEVPSLPAEITVDQAVDTLIRLAPEKLRLPKVRPPVAAPV
jgi:hypothetical protein